MQVEDAGRNERTPDAGWPTDWMRAVLGLCTLRVLESGPSYGYAIIAELERSGLGTVKGGTLYPLLTRYESAGWVTTEWRAGTSGPGRKYFSLTPAGRVALGEQRRAWGHFTTATRSHLGDAPEQPPAAGQPTGPSPLRTQGAAS